MKLQYVFGNPSPKKAKKKGAKKVAKKKVSRKNPQKTKVVAKKKSRKMIKSGPQKGNYRTVRKKVSSRSGMTVMSAGDVHKERARLSSLRSKIAYLVSAKKKVKGPKKKKIGALINKSRKVLNSLNNKYKKRIAFKAAEKQLIKDYIKEVTDAGYEAEKTINEFGGPVARKKKATRKKASKKKTTRKKTKKKATRKKAKKKTTRKKAKKKAVRKKAKKKTVRKKRRKKAVAKKKKTTRKKRRKTTRKKAAKKTTRKKTRRKSSAKKAGRKKSRKKTGRKKSSRKKKGTFKGIITMSNPFKGIRKGNPMKLGGMQVAGYDPMELAELGVGGLFYGAANSYISPMFSKIPGLGQFAGALGGTLPSLIAGVALNIASDKVGNKQAKKALNFLGDGLLGAAVVGAGVHLSQTLLPAPAMAGVDYIPSGGKNDFGGVDFTPEMGGVDYTPEMSGVDYIQGANMPGANDNADFGAYEESHADFGAAGSVPEGMN